MKRFLLSLHRYAGLAVAVFLLLIALTGIALIFERQLFEWELGPQVAARDANGRAMAPFEDWVRAGERQHGGLQFVYGVFVPESTSTGLAVGQVIGMKSVDGTPEFVSHLVDPYTAEPLSELRYSHSFAAQIVYLHVLLVMPFGDTLAGGIGLLGALLVLIGVFVAWPRKGTWSNVFSLRRLRADVAGSVRLHRLAGLVFAIPLLALLISGVGLVKPAWTGAVLRQPSASLRLKEYRQRSGRPPECTAADFDSAARAASRRVPDGTVRGVVAEPGVFVVSLMRPGDTNHRLGDVTVQVASDCGDVIGVAMAGLNTDGSATSALLPLHGQLSLGSPGRVLVFFSGVVLAWMAVSGCLTWWLRRRRSLRGSRR